MLSNLVNQTFLPPSLQLDQQLRAGPGIHKMIYQLKERSLGSGPGMIVSKRLWLPDCDNGPLTSNLKVRQRIQSAISRCRVGGKKEDRNDNSDYCAWSFSLRKIIREESNPLILILGSR